MPENQDFVQKKVWLKTLAVTMDMDEQCPFGSQEVGSNEAQLGPLVNASPFEKIQYEDGELALGEWYQFSVYNKVNMLQYVVSIFIKKQNYGDWNKQKRFIGGQTCLKYSTMIS